MSIAVEPRREPAPTPWPAAAVVVALVAMVLLGALVLKGGVDNAVHFADATDAAAVARGAVIYRHHCAACHGDHLQGQPGWKVIPADGVLHAPPQDDTGHTWMHSDEDLFGFVKYGMADYLPPGLVSSMPAFAGKLGDAQIEDTLAFIKSHWSVGMRAYQALLNPGRAGMPKAAKRAGAWVLPPDCSFEFVRKPLRPPAAKR
jgi:mono/diheme cytochrome c family protein